ncbi:MAG: hypothetical protein ACOX1F_00060 [Erysipelotrichaceae bacterium]|jgi:predicted bacteriocin transport accessory protein
MKKLFILVILVLTVSGCQKEKIIEYQKPTGTVSDMSGYQGLVSEQFYDITVDEVLEKIENGETFIVYFGYVECPWCNCVVPVLNEVSVENDMPIYYLDFHSSVNSENASGMREISEFCGNNQQGLKEGQFSFSFPTVLYIRKGELYDVHIGTVYGHNGFTDSLTEKQRERLTYQYNKEFTGLLIIEN